MYKEDKPPFSIRLTKLILSILIFVFSFSILIGLFVCIFQNKIPQCLPPGISVCINLAFLLVSYQGIKRRKSYGKWLGIIFLLMLMVIGIAKNHYFQIIYNSVTQAKPLPTPPYECWQRGNGVVNVDCGYSTYLDLAMRATLNILFPHILFGFLAIRLMVSRSVRNFFNT